MIKFGYRTESSTSRDFKAIYKCGKEISRILIIKQLFEDQCLAWHKERGVTNGARVGILSLVIRRLVPFIYRIMSYCVFEYY